MHDVLSDLSKILRIYLEEVLPSCNAKWWDTLVVDQLTYAQQAFVRERRITNLSGLDLAGLLRVVDRNWSEIQGVRRLPFEARTWLKESQSIRNRWAHESGVAVTLEDRYRDLDTIIRLLRAIGADPSVVERATAARGDILQQMGGTTAAQESPARPTEQTRPAAAAESVSIGKGDIVRLRARPEVSGAVVDVIVGGQETRYGVPSFSVQ